MGGQGSGHKSVRAIEARLKNIQKARAARKRAPLPWRSGVESRIIEQLVWQWWVDKNSGQWLVASGEKNRQQWPAFAKATARQASGQVPHRHPAKPAGCVRDDKFGRAWAKYRVARLLGVSHTWVNKLVKRIELDPERMRRKMRAFPPASFEKLERAREETRREPERGLLRGPMRWRRVKVTLEGKEKKVVAATRAESQRRQAEVEGERARLRQGYGEASEQGLRKGRVEMQRDSASRPPRRAGAGGPAQARRVNPAPTKARAAPVRYSELPQWARGLPLPGVTGSAALPLSGPFVPQGKQAGGRGPRPVPFAFRRRR